MNYFPTNVARKIETLFQVRFACQNISGEVFKKTPTLMDKYVKFLCDQHGLKKSLYIPTVHEPLK